MATTTVVDELELPLSAVLLDYGLMSEWFHVYELGAKWNHSAEVEPITALGSLAWKIACDLLGDYRAKYSGAPVISKTTPTLLKHDFGQIVFQIDSVEQAVPVTKVKVQLCLHTIVHEICDHAGDCDGRIERELLPNVVTHCALQQKTVESKVLFYNFVDA
jgi:hypothetical protein